MTTQEFMDELQEVGPLFAWRLEPDMGFHADRRKSVRLHIRGVVRRGTDSGTLLDPMGAVWYARTGEVLLPPQWAEAGDLLGLLPVRAAELHAAGNDITWAGAEGKREPVEYLQTLRARLIAAIGLPVTTTPGARIL